MSDHNLQQQVVSPVSLHVDGIALRHGDLPASFHAADESSNHGQREVLRTTLARLLLFSAAALAGAVSLPSNGWSLDTSGFVIATCFAVALVIETNSLRRRPDRTWFGGRAVAESVKTLAWRYAVGGHPFPVSAPPADADALLLRRVADVLTALRDLSVNLVQGFDTQITAQMHQLRKAPLPDRKVAYLRGRIAEQKQWYTARGQAHRTAASRWASALMAIEAGGLVGAVLKMMNVVDADTAGIAAALAAAATAWVQTRQHDNLGTSYALAALELASVESKSELVNGEDQWSRFVSEAEEAISREHTMWKASRGVV